MLVEYTREEQERIDLATQEVNEILKRGDAIKAEKDITKRRQLAAQQQAEIEMADNNRMAIIDEIQEKYFKEIATGTEAIIEHAQGQIGPILEKIHTSFVLLTTNNKGASFVTIEGESVYVKADVALDAVKYELRFHIKALQDDRDALLKLFSIITEEIENSPYTDNKDFVAEDPNNLKDVMRFRRNPLTDLEKYGLMNDKATAQLLQDQDLFTQKPNGQLVLKWAVNQAPQQNKPIPIYMSLTYEGENIKYTKKLTAFDNAVYNAVSTCFYYWAKERPGVPLYITPTEIWRTMNGKQTRDGHLKPREGQLKKICDSLDKMRFTRFYLDISAEMKANYITLDDDRITGGKIETYLLNSTKVEFTTEKGRIVQGYRIAEEPILYTYNAAKKHILFVDFKLLDTSTGTQNSEYVAEFRNYLIQQIELMKNAGKKGNFKRNKRILISKIYEATGIDTPEERLLDKEVSEQSKAVILSRTKDADRKKIEGILSAWIDMGYIKGFTPVKQKKSTIGYDICL